MDDLIKEFLVESNENLDRLDSELVKLETDPSSQELLSSIFRTIHTIKGSCGFLGFSKLEKVAHVGESLLSRLREGKLSLSPEFTSGLLAMVDAIRVMLGEIQDTGQDGNKTYPELIETLTKLQNQGQEITPKLSPAATLPKEASKKRKGSSPKEHSAISVPPISVPIQEEQAPPTPPTPSAPLAGAPEESPAAQHNQDDPHSKNAAGETIRVDVRLLDRLMNLVGELVLTRNQITQFSARQSDANLLGPTQQLNLLTSELQEEVMRTRMQPISNVFDKFPRVVRDVATAQGKQVVIEMEGKETELDRSLLEAIKDPLTHIVRNSVDHGIETPEQRVARGKRVEGHLKLRACHEGGQVLVEISDDGAGIDTARVKSKAIERGIIAIAGWASNGRLALAKLQTLRPDVILLDIEMPEMDGLEAIPEIRKILPHTPIIMFSTLTERGAEATLDALALGASDYVAKPSNQNMAATSEAIHRDLVPKIKALCHFHARVQGPLTGVSLPTVAPRQPEIRFRATPLRCAQLKIISIGVSTGGPDALAKLLPAFPAKFPLPVVIAQHMPAIFTTLLAKRLASKCALPVRECQAGDLLTPSCVWIAPGDYHMVVQNDDHHMRLGTHQGPRENFCRPSVDVLFRSVAAVYGPSALGVILTGMGQDGLKGCEALCTAGASVIVQDEASSVVWGMPGFVARAGLAEKILPLDQIGNEIIRRVAAQPAFQLTH